MGLITKCSTAWFKKKTLKIKEQSRTTFISSFMKIEKFGNQRITESYLKERQQL